MISFDYQTGRIERDFHFVKVESICELLHPIRSYVGGEGCSHCGCNKGTYSTKYDTCVLCSHPNAKDSPGTDELRFLYMENFKDEALSHYYD